MAIFFQSLPPPSSISFLRLKARQLVSRHRHVISHHRSTSISSLKPYLQSELQPILLGWACSAVSVYSLSQIVPKLGSLTSAVTSLDLANLPNQALLLGTLLLLRHVASYFQQAFLWEAALNCAYSIRVDVFNKVVKNDLGFFEGKDGVSSGDIAYRITAEAADVADTVYHLLNAIVPSLLQLSAMAAQMVAISPILSLISSLVIPSMAIINLHLGEKLREISNRAHLSVATLSAYLNEIPFRCLWFLIDAHSTSAGNTAFVLYDKLKEVSLVALDDVVR